MHKNVCFDPRCLVCRNFKPIARPHPSDSHLKTWECNKCGHTFMVGGDRLLNKFAIGHLRGIRGHRRRETTKPDPTISDTSNIAINQVARTVMEVAAVYDTTELLAMRNLKRIYGKPQ